MSSVKKLFSFYKGPIKLNIKLKEKTMESLASVLPITTIVLLISLFLVPLEVGTIVVFFVGAFMLIFGIGMFQLGAEMAMSPLGEGIGNQIAKSQKILPIMLVSFVIGTLITIAEPDLQVLSNQVPAIPNMVLILTVAIGVGLFLTMAVLRIMLRLNLSKILLIMYTLLIILSFCVDKNFFAVSFDSGGVTTGPITVPFIMALGVGISAMRGDKNATDDSFGLVALSSVGPILAVMILGCLYDTSEAAYIGTKIPVVETMQDVVRIFCEQIPRYAREVFLSIFPIVLMFLVFQLFSHRYQKRQLIRIAIGFVYTYLGLVLFLCGVNVGFAPVGTIIGKELANAGKNGILIIVGVVIGFYIVKAEPAIQVLNQQVQSITNGLISEKSMNHCLSFSVAISVGLSMFRVITGLPLQWIIIPGYILVIIMSCIAPPVFVGIAFDSGGVASGPMTSTFLLPLCIGICEVMGGNIMTDAFGVVALVAMTPIIAIQIMGLQFKYKQYKLEKQRSAIDSQEYGDNEIIEFEEE